MSYRVSGQLSEGIGQILGVHYFGSSLIVIIDCIGSSYIYTYHTSGEGRKDTYIYLRICHSNCNWYTYVYQQQLNSLQVREHEKIVWLQRS